MANLAKFFDQTSVANFEYYSSIFAQRTAENVNQGGSYYEDKFMDTLEAKLKSADWVKSTTYPDKQGQNGSIIKTYRAKVGGFFGMLPLSQVPDNAPLFGFDPKKTGYGSAALVDRVRKRRYFGYSHLILAVNPDSTGFILTFFPGPSIQPQEVSSEQIAHGQPLTKTQLQALGLEWVKLVY